MQTWYRSILFILIASSLLQNGQPLFASSDLGTKTPTFSLSIFAGLTTHKSKIAASNDTTTSSGYSLSGSAGSSRNLGFFIRSDSMSTNFALNNSSMKISWQDSGIMYRLSYFYIGIITSTVDALINVTGTDLVDAGGAGMGGGIGFLIPVSKRAIFFLDIASVTISKTRNSLTQETSIGARQDIDLGATIDLTKKAFDYMIGYKQRTVTITTDTAYKDEITSTYFGFRWGTFF